jgi:hypothetical protein
LLKERKTISHRKERDLRQMIKIFTLDEKDDNLKSTSDFIALPLAQKFFPITI